MYIEQVQGKNFNWFLYLPIPLVLIGIMIINYFFSKGVDVNQVIQKTIDEYGTNLTFVLIIIPLSIACLVLLFWVKYIHNQSIRSLTTSRKKVDWNRIFFSFSVWGFFTLASTMIIYFISPENFTINFDPIHFFVFLFLAIILIPLQTSFEEYLFRGYLMQGIGVVTKSRLVPLVFTSVLFGVMHIANPEVGKLGMIIMIYYIGTGFFLGIITLMDEGLELALGIHAANNLIGALLVTADWTAFQTDSIFKDVSEPSAGFDVLFPIFVIFPILLIIFGRKYGWTNWKEKLTGSVKPLSSESEQINTIGNDGHE